MTTPRTVRPTVVVAVVMVFGLTAAAAEPPAPSAEPTPPPPATKPSPEARAAARLESDRKVIGDYLLGEYRKLSTGPDWVRRAMGTISAARLPIADVPAFLLDVLEKDKHPVVQMLAWEALRSRAEWLSAEQHKRWVAGTVALAKRDAFRGRLRAPLIELLATAPHDKAVEQTALALVAKVYGTGPEDQQVLAGVGRALGQWRAAQPADVLFARLGTGGLEEWKAACVLSAAGFPLPGFAPPAAPDRDRDPDPEAPPAPPPPTRASARSLAEVKAWWRAQRAGDWKAPVLQVEGEPWRRIRSDLLENVPADAYASFQPNDKRWYRELELGKPDLAAFDVAFAIDVSSSMYPAVAWVRREVGGMMQVLGIVAREPRVGLTFFGCRGDNVGVRSHKLTSDVKQLTALLAKQTFDTGGEELVLDGMTGALRAGPWSTAKKAAKVLILVGDEEIEAAQMPGCLAAAREAAAKGFRIYALCPGAVPKEYAEVCEAGNGEAFPILTDRAGAARRPGAGAAREENPAQVIVTRILAAAITPEFKDRIDPMVAVVMAMNTEDAPPVMPKRGRR